MSDVNININISFSNYASNKRTVEQSKKRKKNFKKRQRFLQKKRDLDSQQKNTDSGQSSKNQTALYNGTSKRHQPFKRFKQNRSSLRPDTTSASHSYSRTSDYQCTLPSLDLNVKSESTQGKPCSTKSATTTPTPDVNQSLPQPSSSVGASLSGSGPPALRQYQFSWASTVKSEINQKKPKDRAKTESTCSNTSRSASSSNKPAPTKYLALDCEMVGAGPKGSVNQLARCSLVSYDGDVVYDKFIKPPLPITDYRTRWSGVRRSDLIGATPFAKARKEILKLLMGKVVVGHAVHNDFHVLQYTHPAALTRDTSRIPLLNLKAGLQEKDCASLKRLTKAIFNRDIQTGKKGHCSVEDARATMKLYRVVEEEWEGRLASK